MPETSLGDAMRQVTKALIKAKRGESLTELEKELVTLCPTVMSYIHFDEVRQSWVF